MPRYDPQVVSFSSGELSPVALGRVDSERYGRAAKTLDNFIVTPTGAVIHRPGTQYLGESNGGDKTALLPFVANSGSEFVIEVGDASTRVWYGASRRLVYDNAGTWNITGTGSVATISTPWTAADLFDTDGSCKLRFVQSNDVMWIVHPSYFPYKISRTATYKFEGAYMGDGRNAAVPFKDFSPDQATTLQASAATGAGVTITASAATFTAADVGGWLYIERPKSDATPPWETAKAIALNDVRSSSGRYYGAANAATTGTVKPTHSYGTRIDGVGGVNWEWHDDGYGWAAITGYTDTTHVTVTVVRRLPDTVVSSTTTRWARGAWTAADGYPSSIAFFRDRLCFARDQTVWTSVASDYENFQVQDGGVVSPDMAITLTVASNRSDRIRWIAATQDALLAGTASGEWAISEQSTSDPLGPANVRAKRIAGYGASGVQPELVGETLVYVERGGKRMRQAQFDIQVDSFVSRDLNVYADHIWTRGTCAGMAAQRVPFGVLWGITNGGQLKGLTLQREHEVWAWHGHTLGGDGLGTNLTPAVRSICSIASPDGVNDDLWMVVERRINGSTVYYVEVLGPHLAYTLLGYVYADDLTNIKDALHLDCAVQKVVLSGATSITGLSHLEGEDVAAVVDGMYRAPTAVSGGARAVSGVDEDCKAWVGFLRNGDVIPAPLTGQSAVGSPEGKKRRITSVTVRVKDSLNFVAGRSGGTLDRAKFRKTSADMSEASPLRTGDFRVLYPQGSTEDEERPEFLVRQDQPFPLVILGMFPELTTEP